MTPRHPLVFLVDVDNTLLDNDAIQQDLKDHLERTLASPPASATGGFWRICSQSWGIATISALSSATGPNTRAM